MLLARIENPVLRENLKAPRPGEAGNILGRALSSVIVLFLSGALIAFVFYFLVGGISWIMSQGEEAKVKKARDTLTHALSGLLITFSIYALLKLIGYIFGVRGLEEMNLPLIPLI